MIEKSALRRKTIPRNGSEVQGKVGKSEAGRRLGRPAPKSSMGGLLLDAVLQGLSGMECREARRGDLDLFAGLRIPSVTRLALPGLEGSESGDLDLLSRHERGRDDALLARREDHLDDGARLTGGNARLLRDHGYEFGLVHWFSHLLSRNEPHVTPHPGGGQRESASSCGFSTCRGQYAWSMPPNPRSPRDPCS